MNGGAGVDADACDVAAGMSQILNEAGGDGIAAQGDDRDLVRLTLEKLSTGTHGIYDVRIIADDFRRQRYRPRNVALAPATLDDKILPLDVPKAPKLGEQRPVIAVVALLIHERRWLGRAEDGQTFAGRRRLLRARRERQRDSTADKTNELAPPHSITSSARARIEGGMVRPSTLAVFMLMRRRNRIGCSTGRSAGLAPLRIFDNNSATLRFASGISLE